MKYLIVYGSNQQVMGRLYSTSRDTCSHGQELLGTTGGGIVTAYKEVAGLVMMQVSQARYSSENGGRWYNC